MELLRAEHLTKTYGKDENVVAALGTALGAEHVRIPANQRFFICLAA